MEHYVDAQERILCFTGSLRITKRDDYRMRYAMTDITTQTSGERPTAKQDRSAASGMDTKYLRINGSGDIYLITGLICGIVLLILALFFFTLGNGQDTDVSSVAAPLTTERPSEKRTAIKSEWRETGSPPAVAATDDHIQEQLFATTRPETSTATPQLGEEAQIIEPPSLPVEPDLFPEEATIDYNDRAPKQSDLDMTTLSRSASNTSEAPWSDPSVDSGEEQVTLATDEPLGPSSKVARAQFTTAIDEREPIDHLESVIPIEEGGMRRIFYFTELRDMGGKTVTHRWEYEGRVMAEINFDVGSDQWRVYSSKRLLPSLTGEWRVVVTDSQGRVLKVSEFQCRFEPTPYDAL